MEYAVVALCSIFLVKYILPFLDNLFELFSMFLARKANKINIEMEVAKFKAEEMISSKSPAIGFSMGDESCGCCADSDDEDDEDDTPDDKLSMKGRIGFRL